MLNIYTSRQKLIGRNVVYNLYDFFDNTVVDAIAQNRYMLTDEDRVTLGKEGYITGVADGIISTKYGEMTLKNISLAAKAILSIRYLAAVDMCTVLNITDVLYDLEEVLKTAEQEHIGVLLYFKYYPMSWKNIEITACFNDDTVMPMKEYSESVTEFGEGYGREIYLSFGDDAAHFELFSTSRRMVIRADNVAQKALLFKALRAALTNRTAKVTEFRKLNADGESFDLNRVIVEETENSDIFGRLLKTGQPYVAVIDGDKNRNPNYICYANMWDNEIPVYELIIVSDSNEETLCCSDLQERYIPSDSFGKDRFEFSLKKHILKPPLISEDFLELDDNE